MTVPTSPQEIRISKIIGSERIVIEQVAVFASSVGFELDRIEDIKTAVGEAALNAMEHTSAEDSADVVTVRFWQEEDAMKVSVASNGRPFQLSHQKPDMRAKIEGRDPPRGWGVYLMKQLADATEFGSQNDLTIVTMSFRHRNNRYGADNS